MDISGMPGKIRLTVSSFTIFKLNSMFWNMISLAQEARKLIVVPSSLVELIVHRAVFPMAFLPSITKPLPCMSEVSLSTMPPPFLSKTLLH